MLIEAIDTWLERKLIQTLQLSPFLSLLANECEDISSQEELAICHWWIVNCLPEKHFLAILHVKVLDAKTITGTLTSFTGQKNLNYRKLVGRGYDGAAVFSGFHSGV